MTSQSASFAPSTRLSSGATERQRRILESNSDHQRLSLDWGPFSSALHLSQAASLGQSALRDSRGIEGHLPLKALQARTSAKDSLVSSEAQGASARNGFQTQRIPTPSTQHCSILPGEAMQIRRSHRYHVTTAASSRSRSHPKRLIGLKERRRKASIGLSVIANAPFGASSSLRLLVTLRQFHWQHE